MKKALQAVKSVLAIVGLVALGVLTGALLFRKTGAQETDDAQKAREDKKNEIENTPADVLVSASDNADELRSVKDGIRADFRSRIRHRLSAELQRLGSGSADSDSGTGSASGD
ncbi:MAG: hypothetical protein IJ158_09255 [Treponema sp.]|nr:hypothetical protein [Treponema sp.]